MVYICSPLRGHYEENIKNANRYCQIAAGLGVIPLAPHTIFTQYLNDTLPDQREQGLQMGLALLERCDEVWRMGPIISEGMRGETELAAKLGIPVHDIAKPLEAGTYPASADNHPLLGINACWEGSNKATLERGDIIVCKHDQLNEHSRIPINQLWRVSHGNGCDINRKGRSIFCSHVADDDFMAFYREDIYGIVKPEVLSAVMAAYGHEQDGAAEQDGEEIGI